MPKKRLHVYDDKSSVRRAQGAIVGPCVGQSSDLSAGHRRHCFANQSQLTFKCCPSDHAVHHEFQARAFALGQEGFTLRHVYNASELRSVAGS